VSEGFINKIENLERLVPVLKESMSGFQYKAGVVTDA
jgi:hypothetical protein